MGYCANRRKDRMTRGRRARAGNELCVESRGVLSSSNAEARRVACLGLGRLPRFVHNGRGTRVIRTASKSPDDARRHRQAQPAPHSQRGSTASRRRCPQQRYMASVAFATPDCISCAFITGESVIFAGLLPALVDGSGRGFL
jgi:hypothetical protein